MNAWFDRLLEAVHKELGDAGALDLTRDDARLLLDLARDVAHGSGARQYAPLATYLAGLLVAQSGAQSDPVARERLFAALSRAAATAGPAGPEPL